VTSDGAWGGLDGQHFELVSRGDFVSGLLHRPQAGANASALPLVIVLHDAGEHARTSGSDVAAEWCEAGLAVARLDLALHGHRASPKLSERLVQGCAALAAGDELDPDSRALVEEFARQSVSDLLRTAEALSALAGIDATRLAFVGRGIGAWIAAWAAPFAPALRLCVLAGGIGRLVDPELDPARRLAETPPAHTVRFLHEQRGGADGTPLEAQAALFAALPEPRHAVAVGDADGKRDGFAKPVADAIRSQLVGPSSD
jgi:dienelactone hydrolase